MKIIGIKTNDGYFITNDLKSTRTYSDSQSSLLNLLINGEQPTLTFHKLWVKVKEEPTRIQRYVSQPAINKRYELKDKSLADKFKDVWAVSEAKKWDPVNEETIYSDGFIQELYELKQDTQPDILEDIEFEYETILSINEIKTPQEFSYKRSGQYDNSEKYQNVTDKSLQFDMISQIITPSILLPTQPCKLSKKETYDIIRNYIKENINGKVAAVTSDYDFCLTVKKKINLAKPHSYTVDVNDSFFGGRKKKPKYETILQTANSVTVFECAPAPYQSYTVIEAFQADSQDELKLYIDNYLEHLISVINEPLQYCECCEGTGVKTMPVS